jgi:hypothetical protein
MRSALFWDITPCTVAIPYGRFGITYWSHLQRSINPEKGTCISLPLNMRPTGCPETSVREYRSMLLDIAEECRSQDRSNKGNTNMK